MTDTINNDDKPALIKQEAVRVFDDTADGIALLGNTVEAYSKTLGVTKKFVMSAFVKGASMGMTNPLTCIASFWDFDGTAEIKTDALQNQLLSKNHILEPFKIIDDCKPVYKYYDQDEVDKFIKTHGKEFYMSMIKDKTKTPWNKFAKMLMPHFFYKGSNADNVAKGTEKQCSTPHDWVTTLEATVFNYKREVITKRHSYYYSTAEAKELPFEKGLAPDGSRKIKKVWKDKSWMMYKRCAGQLSGIVAPGAAYGVETKDGYENARVLEREHANHLKDTGNAPNINEKIIDVDSEDVTVNK